MKRFTIFFFALAVAMSIAPQQAKAQEAWNVTLLSHIDPASSYFDVWGYVDSSGTEYALLTSNDGIKLVDLTNQASPSVVSTFGFGTDVKAFDHYVATSGGEIYDVSDVTNPVMVSTFPGSHNIFVSYPYLFLAGPNLIYDITDPTNPVFVSFYGSGYHDVTVINDTLYNAGGSTGTEIFDISDIINPALLAFFHLEGEYSHSVWPTEDRNYLLLTDELGPWGLTIWDIRDMSSPERVAQYKISSTPHNVNVRGNYAYVSHYTAGLRVLDVADPTDPVEVGFLDTYPADNSLGFNGAWGVYAFLPSELLLISDRQTGLYVAKFDSVKAASMIGIVRDAADSTAVEGAQVILAGPGRATFTGLDGEFSFRTADGEDTLNIYKFGYHPAAVGVNLLAGETLSVVIDIVPIERGTITGMLTDTSGSGVAALLILYLDGAPISPWDTLWVGQEGGIEYSALPGNYRVVINPVLPYASVVVEGVVVEAGVTASVNLQVEVADVFLFDDDEGDQYETYFLSSLEELALSVNYRDLNIWGTPAASQLEPVEEPVIIWFTGDDSVEVLTLDEQAFLIGVMLEQQGRILLTGQNIAESLPLENSFRANWLQVHHVRTSTSFWSTGIDGDPVSHGLQVVPNAGSGGADNQYSKDTVARDTGSAAEPSLIYFDDPDTLFSAVRLENEAEGWKLYFMAFGAEAIRGHGGTISREEFLGRVITWFRGGTAVGIDDSPLTEAISQEFALGQNYPNPFNPTTIIKYALPQFSNVTLTIYNLRGEEVDRLVDGQKRSGYHKVTWDASNVSSGIYFYRLQAGDFVQTRKMVLLK